MPFILGEAVLLISFFLVALAQPPFPQSEAPEEVMRRSIGQVLEILRDTQQAGPNRRDERLSRIRAVADEVFDWQEMAKRSLGVHWRKLNVQQQERFVETFEEVLAAQYTDDLTRFRGNEKVIIESTEVRASSHVVRTILVTHSRERVPIHYVMHRGDAGWRVHDVSIEGVSLVNHYRGTFSRFLVNQSFDALLKRLELKRQTVAR